MKKLMSYSKEKSIKRASDTQAIVPVAPTLSTQPVERDLSNISFALEVDNSIFTCFLESNRPVINDIKPAINKLFSCDSQAKLSYIQTKNNHTLILMKYGNEVDLESKKTNIIGIFQSFAGEHNISKAVVSFKCKGVEIKEKLILTDPIAAIKSSMLALNLAPNKPKYQIEIDRNYGAELSNVLDKLMELSVQAVISTLHAKEAGAYEVLTFEDSINDELPSNKAQIIKAILQFEPKAIVSFRIKGEERVESFAKIHYMYKLVEKYPGIFDGEFDNEVAERFDNISMNDLICYEKRMLADLEIASRKAEQESKNIKPRGNVEQPNSQQLGNSKKEMLCD